MDSSIQPPPPAPLSGVVAKGDSNGTGNVSDEEGFLSGEEEFQVASESPVAPISDHPFSVSADEMFKPAAEDVEGKEEDETGKKMLEEDGYGKLKELSNGHHDDSGSAASYTRELKVDKGGGAGGVGDSEVKLEDAQGALGADNGEKLNKNAEKIVEVGDGVVLVNEKSDNVGVAELIADDPEDGGRVAQVKGDGVPVVPNDNSVESNEEELKLVETDAVKVGGVRITPEGDSVVDAIDADVKVPGVAVVWNEPAKEEELPVDAPVVASGNIDERNVGESKAAESDVGDADGVRLTPEGDSIVDTVDATVDADVKVPGVVVVGKATELEPAKEEFHVDAPVVTTDHVDETNRGGSKADESDVDDVAGVRLTSEGDSVVDTIDADVNVPGVAVVKTAESEPAEVEVEPPVGTTSEPAKVEEEPPVGTTSEPAEVEEELPVGTTSEPVEVEEELPVGHFAALADRNGSVSEVVVDALASKTDVADDACVKPAVDSNELQGLDTNQSVLVDDAVETVEADRGLRNEITEGAGLDGSVSDDETDGMIFGSSEAAKQFIEQLEQGSGSEVSRDHLQRMDGQVVTDSDEEVDTDDEGEGKELLDPSALAALLKAATGADVGGGGGGITITSQDGTRLFSVERPAGLGSSLRALRPNTRQTPLNMFAPATNTDSADSEVALSDEEKKTLEKLQQVRVKYLRLVHRLGLSPDDSVPAQVLYRMMLIMGRQGGRAYTMDAAKRTALQLEAEEANDMDLSLNILVLGKCGVGKSATINSILGEEKAHINAFQPATGGVQEIVGYVNGVKLRVFDTPGLRCSVYEQSFNRNILSSVKRATKKHPLDIVLYVDRLDSQTRDMNDVPMLRTITSSLGSSIWKMAIITLTHAATAPPDGPTGSPLSYDQFASQRSHVLQQTVSAAAGEIRMLNPSLMHPVALVENHASCRKNREGQKVLPNGQSWRPQLLLLCYSLKILAEVNSISKPQDAFDHRKIFGLRGRSPPLPYMLSSMLQSRAHPKLPNEQGGDNGDSDIDLDYFSDSDEEEEDEYDQLPPFKPLRKAQLAKLSKDQRRAYFEEYDYRVKLLQKKQLREELKRMKEMKNKGKDATVDYGYMEEDGDSGAAAPVAVPLPDMVLPPSFDSDNPAYRYRFLEPTSQFLARPVLDTHGWDHDCGYDGVNVEQGLAIVNRFPAAVTFQITKDKKDFTVSLDSSVSAKHGENGSSMAGFDIQSLGKQLAYTVRGETKFKNLKRNKTSGGISITFLGDNIVSGAKLEDQITLGKQYVLVGSAGAVRSDRDTAYGANFELQRREADFPIGQAQSTLSMSLIKWRGDLALGVNSLFQFSVGRGSKVAIRAGLNNKLSGQISVKTSSSDHLSLALTAFLPTAIAIYKKLYPGAPEQYAMY